MTEGRKPLFFFFVSEEEILFLSYIYNFSYAKGAQIGQKSR